MSIFKLSCACKENEFVFGTEPKNKVVVVCPACKKTTTYIPDPKQKEDDK